MSSIKTSKLFTCKLFTYFCSWSLILICDQIFLVPFSAAQFPAREKLTLGFMGVEIAGVGIQIQSIDPSGPLSKLRTPGNPNAALMVAEPGDVILAIGNQPVTSMAALEQQVDAMSGSARRGSVLLQNVQDGGVYTFEVTATPLAPVTPQPSRPSRRVSYSLQINGEEVPGEGIRIKSITPGGAASKLKDVTNPTGDDIYLDPGDLIVSVNGLPTRNAAEYQTAMDSLEATAGRGIITIRDVRTGMLRDFNAIAAVFNNPAPGPDPVPNQGPRRVHVVICGQTGTAQDGFNNCIRKTLTDLDRLFERVDQRFIASKTVLRDGQCTATRIRETLQNLRPSPQDTIFFYYSGHGAYDSNGHFLQLSATRGADMPRSKIRQLIQQHNVRLSVFITESCNASGEPRMVGEQRTAMATTNTLTEFEDLLLSYRGYIELNSSDTNQFGWGTPTHGGFFSKFFTGGLTGLSPTNGWQARIGDIAQKTNSFYQEKRSGEISLGRAPQEMRGQSALTPKYYSMQVESDPANITNLGTRSFETIYSSYRPVPE